MLCCVVLCCVVLCHVVLALQGAACYVWGQSQSGEVQQSGFGWGHGDLGI